ncbi:MAG: DUF1566 domain-containing protein [Rhodocyclaceae bacterium]|nr:DUF1566 domain-containing protein [Rhodocyclaceae bacterium]
MQIKNVHIHLVNSALGAAILAGIMAGNTPEAETPEPASQSGIVIPAIGEYWPGQGGIYAGKGRGRDGLRDHHLILATDPASIFNKRMVGTYGIDVTGATSDHNGPANTLALAEAGSELCKEIIGLEIEGHKDFYLMSRTDAQLCWANVPEQFEKEWYLTSTQFSSDTAWLQGFGNGYTYYYGKKYGGRARACRRLFL